MTIEQRVAVLEEIFAKLRDYYILLYSGEEIDALLASAGVPIGITKEYDSVSAMNDDFSSTDVARGQFVLILPTDTSSEDYGKVYLKGSANWVYVFTLTSLTAIKGPQGPAGKTGAKGADGADGKNFMVLGYYETLSALNAAVPSPGPGDTYGVGTEPPYAFYMYDQTISNWRYVGNLQGPAGPTGGEDNFVRYDAAQTLTDEQKTQARTNINAAPDGFGLGIIDWNSAPESDANKIPGTGWFMATKNVPVSGFWFIRQEFDGPSNNDALQTAWPQNLDSYHRGCLAQRYKIGGTWSAWEWVNPPMQLGVEYRTTERYLGKPVYVKAVACGAVPTNSTKTVSFDPSYDAVSTDSTFRALCVWGVTSDHWTLPALLYGYGLDRSINIGGYFNGILIGTTETGVSNSTVTAVVKYIKTTD